MQTEQYRSEQHAENLPEHSRATYQESGHVPVRQDENLLQSRSGGLFGKSALPEAQGVLHYDAEDCQGVCGS